MSTDSQRVAPPASSGVRAQVRLLRAPRLRALPDATEIARTLIDKYGAGAISFARERAARAVEVEDELALAAWRSVIAAAKRLLRGPMNV
jgi:hypothetical protein